MFGLFNKTKLSNNVICAIKQSLAKKPTFFQCTGSLSDQESVLEDLDFVITFLKFSPGTNEKDTFLVFAVSRLTGNFAV